MQSKSVCQLLPITPIPPLAGYNGKPAEAAPLGQAQAALHPAAAQRGGQGRQAPQDREWGQGHGGGCTFKAVPEVGQDQQAACWSCWRRGEQCSCSLQQESGQQVCLSRTTGHQKPTQGFAFMVIKTPPVVVEKVQFSIDDHHRRRTF